MTSTLLRRLPWEFARAWMVPACLALLAACGGGEPASPQAPAVPPQAASLRGESAPGLVPAETVMVDSTGMGNRLVRSIDPLDDGGYALTWLGHDATDLQPSWTLWVRYFDPDGQPRGPAQSLPYAPDIPNPANVAAKVLHDGRVVVAYVVDLPGDPTPLGDRVSSLYLRRFDAQGAQAGDDVLLDYTLHDPLDTTGKILQTPSLAAWDDGAFLVGWHARRLDTVPFDGDSERVQRVEADGAVLRPMDRLFGGAAPMLRLMTLDEGGWIAQSLGGDFTHSLFARIVQVEVAKPYGLPLLTELPPQSFLLDLHGAGAVLFSGQQGRWPGEMRPPYYAQPFDRDGHEAGPPRLLGSQPAAGATALADGGYLAWWPLDFGQPIQVQRFTAHGEPVGAAFAMPVGDLEHATRLAGGGLVVAWVDHPDAGELRLLVQRWKDPG